MIDKDAHLALRHRNFSLFLLAQTISFLGNGVFLVALPLEVLRLTDDPLVVAMAVGADTLVTVVFMLIGGAFVDRLSRRVVMITTNVICGLAIGLVSVMNAVGQAHVWALVGVAFVFGLADAFFLPASTAIMRDLLPANLMVAGNSLVTLGRTATLFVAGPVLGGIIVVAIGPAWAFGLDALSFLIGAVGLLAMRGVKRTAPEAGHEADGATSVREEISIGLAYSRYRPWLWWNMMAVGVASFVGFIPLALLAPLLLRDVLHASPVAYGINVAVSGIGGVAAAVLKKSRDPKLRVPAVWIGFGASGLAVVLLAVSPNIVVATVAGVAYLFGVSYGNINWFALIQEQVPTSLQGRVSSLDWMISLLPGPFGLAVAAMAVDVVGVRWTMAASGILMVLAGSVVLNRKVRDYTYVRGGAKAEVEFETDGAEKTPAVASAANLG
ncbi:MFS transporter [Catellatospora sp. NPDC049133]|jgi:DHA3 family tetracycline resistance protein-like MFS transporter|uniref:MFS transporter n=1 Tax=Catellatospora sp. NPDC049133 TaxID=3155499 RepID=UPI0033F57B65